MTPPVPTGSAPVFATALGSEPLKGKGETGEPVFTVSPTGVPREPVASNPTNETPDRCATAARWRQDEARRVAIMGDAAGTPEGVRRLVAAGELSEQAGATLLAVMR